MLRQACTIKQLTTITKIPLWRRIGIFLCSGRWETVDVTLRYILPGQPDYDHSDAVDVPGFKLEEDEDT